MKKYKKTLIVIALLLIIGIMEITNIIPIGLLQKNSATTVQAYTYNPDNILNNVYEKDGLTILPFIFESPFQMIQKSYVIDQFKEAGLNVENQESLGTNIVTGNEIKTNTKTYTVLIFGDVDQNGIIDSFDALSIIEHIVYGGNSELKGICKLAANVENDSDELDSFDALRIIEFIVGTEKKLVLNEPESMGIGKLVPEYEIPTGLTAKYGQTLADVKLPDGFTFAAPLDTSVGEVGTHTFTVIYTPEDTNKYAIVPGIKITITVTENEEKEIPTYVVPEGLMAIEGQTLAEIELPEGFEFEDPLDTLVGKVGKNIFKVTYTPADTDKYKIVTGIELTIEVIASIEDDTEKITGITRVLDDTEDDTETQISQNIYTENTIATIKSVDDDIELTKDTTGNFVYSYDINTYDGDKNAVEVEFSKGEVTGEIDIKLYATKAGTYTIIPKVSGKKVNGTVKVPAGEEITVKVNEDLTVTDIKIDGKLLSEDATDEISVVTRVGKVVTPTIEFYHIYEDNKYNTTREVKISDMRSTPVELLNTTACGSYIKDIAICGEDGKTEVVYNQAGETSINPYCIYMKGELKTTTACSFDIKVTNEQGVITRKVNVEVMSEGRSKLVESATSAISLYKNYPGTNDTTTSITGTYDYHIVYGEDDAEKYRVTDESGKVYTIIPIALYDEFGDKIPITYSQISNKKIDHSSTIGNKIVLLGNNGTEDVNISIYIEAKPFASYEELSTGKVIYYPANSSDEVKAIGIALQNNSVSSIEDSIEEFEDAGLVRI